MTHHEHPEELLAGYVDGSLTDRERTVVEAHLSTCARCREESALAMRAMAAVRELPEEPVPLGVTGPVMAEIERTGSRARPRRLSQRVVWAAGGAMAAAFVGLLAIWVLPNVGTGRVPTAGGAGGAEAASASRVPAGGGPYGVAGRPVVLERQSTDYDDAALAVLATLTAREAATGRAYSTAQDASLAPSTTSSAAGCLAKGADVQPQDVLVRLISARYKGQPAIIGVYLTGPGAGQPPSSVLVWVVKADGCGFVSFTSKGI
jgi:predicted anti-sigma-YlaC factor YlaD